LNLTKAPARGGSTNDGSVGRDDRCGVDKRCSVAGEQKINWTKTAHHTSALGLIHAHTPLRGYSLSTGSTEQRECILPFRDPLTYLLTYLLKASVHGCQVMPRQLIQRQHTPESACTESCRERRPFSGRTAGRRAFVSQSRGFYRDAESRSAGVENCVRLMRQQKVCCSNDTSTIIKSPLLCENSLNFTT